LKNREQKGKKKSEKFFGCGFFSKKLKKKCAVENQRTFLKIKFSLPD
jgi:hypothetical protein